MSHPRREDVEEVLPLTPLQAGMVFQAALAPGSSVDLVQVEYHVAGADSDLLEASWREVVARHPALRTTFHWEGLPRPLQATHRRVDLPVTRDDWRGLGQAEVAAALARYLAEDRARSIRLDQPPLMRFFLARTGEREHRLIWTLHHALVDGWSRVVVEREVEAVYRALDAGETPSLPMPAYRRLFVDWISRQDPVPAAQYWAERLAGPSEAAPLAAIGGRGESPGPSTVRWELDDAVSAALRHEARRGGLSPSAVVHGAWAALLGRYADVDDVTFGSTVSGRATDLPGIDRMVGLLANTLPVRVNVRGSLRGADLMSDVQEQLLEMQRFQHCALWDVRDWGGQPGRSPFDSICVFDREPAMTAGTPGGRLLRQIRAHERPGIPMSVLAAMGPRLRVSLLYERGAFERSTASRS